MTSWHLADLESSLVPACPGSSTNTPYTGCRGAARAGSHGELCHTKCPYSGTAATAAVSARSRSTSSLRNRAGTAWTRTQAALPWLVPAARAHGRSSGAHPARFARTQTYIDEFSPSAFYTCQGMLQESAPRVYERTWTLPALSIASPGPVLPLPASDTAQPLFALLSLYLCAANMILAPTKSGCSFTNCLVTSR